MTILLYFFRKYKDLFKSLIKMKVFLIEKYEPYIKMKINKSYR